MFSYLMGINWAFISDNNVHFQATKDLFVFINIANNNNIATGFVVLVRQYLSLCLGCVAVVLSISTVTMRDTPYRRQHSCRRSRTYCLPSLYILFFFFLFDWNLFIHLRIKYDAIVRNRYVIRPLDPSWSTQKHKHSFVYGFWQRCCIDDYRVLLSFFFAVIGLFFFDIYVLLSRTCIRIEECWGCSTIWGGIALRSSTVSVSR